MKEEKQHIQTQNLKLTLVIDASPAVSSGVAAQALVLFRSDVLGPLQDWNVLQKFPAKFSFRDPTSDIVGAVLFGSRRHGHVVITPRPERLISTLEGLLATCSNGFSHMIMTKTASLVPTVQY